MNQRTTQRLLALGLFAIVFTACGRNQAADSPTAAPSPTSAESTVESTENDAPAQPGNQPPAENESSAGQEQNESSTEAETIEVGTTGDGTGEAAVDAAEIGSPVIFQLEAWADNWFTAYLGEELIVEDSVSINTERSFNAETDGNAKHND